MIRIEDWNEEFRGKTLTGIRPFYKGDDFKPYVKVFFAGDFSYEIHSKKHTFFDGCFINTLRRARPVVEVKLVELDEGCSGYEVWAEKFMLFHVEATFTKPVRDVSPLELFRLDN